MISFELVSIFTQLQFIETREAALKELAKLTNASHALIFGKDKEIGIFLPALGLRQTLSQGGRWQEFLDECAKKGRCKSMLPDLDDGQDLPALGITDHLGLTTIVFLGDALKESDLFGIAALMPILGAKLADERTAISADGHAFAAREASQRAGALNAVLDLNRRDLEEACLRAETELVFRRDAERKLIEADQRKDEFLAMLAHELRNPLAPISMAAQILKLSCADNPRVQQTSQIIERQVRHMTTLLDDLLDVSRVTRGFVTLDIEPLKINGFVEDAIEQVRPLIDERRHHLSISGLDTSVCVQGDRTRLVQIITNLLNNAAKYTQEGGEISITMEVKRDLIKNSEMFVLTIKDNGCGIAPALLPHIFDLFTQAERSADRSQGGLGLGLALVKSLVEAHKGTVSAFSEGLGKGSEFSINLPATHEVSNLTEGVIEKTNHEFSVKSYI